MKVLISANVLGGPGGAQRALHSTLRALDGAEIEVVARRRVDFEPIAGLAHQPRMRSNRDLRWIGSNSSVGVNGTIARALNPMRRVTRPRQDLYLELFQGAPLGTAVRAGMRLLIPSGNTVPAHRTVGFDFVAMQAPSNDELLPPETKSVLLPPPVYPLAETAESPGVALPPSFLLTVFNPYGEIKGSQDLVRIADSSPLPIVWCHTSQTLRFDVDASLSAHPKIVHVESPTPAQLRYLYERTSGYLCLSLSEGFGWSIADALRYSSVVISRPIGVLSDPRAPRNGVHLTGDEFLIDWSILDSGDDPSSRDLEFISPQSFRRSLEYLLTMGRPAR